MNRVFSRVLSAAMAVAAVSILNVSAFAEAVGTVDFDKLLASYNKAQSFNDDMKIRERELEKLRAEYDKQMRETKTSQPNNPVAQEQTAKELQTKFSAKMNEAKDWMNSKSKELETEVNGAISAIATTKKLDIVIAKQFVYHGGTDITNEVLSKLNASAPAAPRKS